jgi:hypothetical protein
MGTKLSFHRYNIVLLIGIFVHNYLEDPEMKNAKLFLSLVSLLVVFSLTACFGTPAQPTIDYQALINTSVAQTEVANGIFSTAIPATAVSTQACVLPTATLQFTNNPLPTFTPYATLVPTAIPCYSIGFIKDVTIKDGTNINQGVDFTKTWRLQNLGSCTWTTSFKLVYVSGKQMGAASSTALPKSVAPGGLVDVSVDMTAPSSNGTYQGYFKLKAADGTVFGLGGIGGIAFWVKIVVATPTAVPVLFAVTNVSNWTVTPNCGSPSVTFTADIKTNAAGRVDFHWIFDNNGTKITGPSGHVDFSKAQTKTVTVTWDLSGLGFTGPGKAYIYDDEPNHQLFGPSGTFNCP